MKPGTAPMTSDLSPVDRLGEIRVRLDAATPGPWGVESSHGELWQIDGVLRDRYGDNAITSNDRATIEFIAAAPADVGWLLEHIEQQADLIAEFRLRDAFASRTIVSLRAALHDARRTAALRDGND